MHISIILLFKFFISIVIVIAANKSDLFSQQEVNEEEVIEYARKKDALFQVTSALNGIGIETLFRKIGKKMIDSNFGNNNEVEEDNNNNNNNNINDNKKENRYPSRKDHITLDLNKNKKTKKKKNCCG